MSSRREPAAIVVGAGAAGLAAAAALGRAGTGAVVLERAERPGESWHRRYEGLRLNTVRWMSSLPGYRMERRYGDWPSREAWAAYLERYAARQGIALRTGIEVERIDPADGGWEVRSSDGGIRTEMVVVATGHDHAPVIPDWPGRDEFAGRLIHSADFDAPDAFADQDVLVVGSGNSATEIAYLLSRGGARRVRISVRTPPLILRREYLGVSVTSFAFLAALLPDRVLDAAGRALQRLAHGDLAPYGLEPSPYGLSRMRRTYWSPPLDSGFVAAVKRGVIEVIPAVEGFAGPDVLPAEGQRLRPDAVIVATGYRTGLEPLVGHLGVLEPDGEPVSRAPTQAPGLFFAGFRFGLAALLPYISLDARAIARAGRA